MNDSVNNAEKSCISNVFRAGDTGTTKEAFTRKWIELINNMERDKQYYTA